MVSTYKTEMRTTFFAPREWKIATFRTTRVIPKENISSFLHAGKQGWDYEYPLRCTIRLQIH